MVEGVAPSSEAFLFSTETTGVDHLVVVQMDILMAATLTLPI